MFNAMLVFLGGGLGAVSRYAVCAGASRIIASDLPLGTFAVNMAGCFAIGLLMALVERGELVSMESRLFLITGFLGGFTTFSAFALESYAMVELGRRLDLLLNIGLSNIVGLAMVFAGMRAARLLG